MLNKVRLSLLSFLLVFTVFFGPFQPSAQAEEVVKEETISVIGNNETLLEKKTFNYEENMTALDVLIDAVGEENIELEDTDFGKMIVGINGVKPAKDDTFYWAIFINGIASPVGAESYIVQEGDSISYKYIDYMEAADSVTLNVINGDDKQEYYPSTFIDNPTALDLLNLLVGKDNVGVTYYGKDAFVNSVNGVKAEGNSYWAFYINDEMASTGLNGHTLENGDKITLSFETWEEETPEEDTEEQPVTEEPTTKAFDSAKFKKAVNSASQYILANKVEDWQAVALNKAGKSLPASYSSNLKSLILEKNGIFSKITDYERLTLGILAAGEDPRNVEGYNFIESIYNGNVTKQGLNGVAYALIALDSANFQVPDTAKWTREKLIDELLKNQHDDGGWSWSLNPPSDSDTTGMVLTALAPYKDQTEVSLAIESAVNYLTKQYQASKVDNSSTAATIVIALSALGIDSHSEEFTKNENSLIEFLLTFQNKDGGFDWQGGEESDSFSSDQGYRGIVAYQLFLEGKGSLYTLPLTEKKAEDEKKEEIANKVVNGKLLVEGQVDLVKSGDVYKVKLDANTFTLTKEMLNGLPKEASIQLSNGSVNATIPVALLLTNSDVIFNFEEVSETVKNNREALSLYDFTMTSDGKKIEFGNHTVTLGFDLTNFNGEWDQLRVYYIGENGEMEPQETTYNEQTKEISALVNHFSIYGVFIDKPSEPKPLEQVEDGNRLPNTATPLFNILALGGALMLIGAGGTIYTRKRQINKI